MDRFNHVTEFVAYPVIFTCCSGEDWNRKFFALNAVRQQRSFEPAELTPFMDLGLRRPNQLRDLGEGSRGR